MGLSLGPIDFSYSAFINLFSTLFCGVFTFSLMVGDLCSISERCEMWMWRTSQHWLTSIIFTIVAARGRCEMWQWHHVSALMNLFSFSYSNFCSGIVGVLQEATSAFTRGQHRASRCDCICVFYLLSWKFHRYNHILSACLFVYQIVVILRRIFVFVWFVLCFVFCFKFVLCTNLLIIISLGFVELWISYWTVSFVFLCKYNTPFTIYIQFLTDLISNWVSSFLSSP